MPSTGVVTVRIPVANVAAGSDLTSPVGVCPVGGTVVEVRYLPTSVLTGANTNSRTDTLYNRGGAGGGSTVVATQAFVTGVNIADTTVGFIPLSGTPANLIVKPGDILDWESLHVGTGLADPGGMLEVDILPSR